MGFTTYWDAEQGMLTMTPPKPKPLTEDEIMELNEELAPLGYVAVPVAGINNQIEILDYQPVNMVDAESLVDQTQTWLRSLLSKEATDG